MGQIINAFKAQKIILIYYVTTAAAAYVWVKQIDMARYYGWFNAQFDFLFHLSWNGKRETWNSPLIFTFHVSQSK